MLACTNSGLVLGNPDCLASPSASAWLIVAVVVLVVLLLLFAYVGSRNNRAEITQAPGSARSTLPRARTNALPNTPKALAAVTRTTVSPVSSALVAAAKRQSNSLIVYSGTTVNIRSDVLAAGNGIIPLTTLAQNCPNFAVTNGGISTQPQPVQGNGNIAANTLELLAWNNLNSSFIRGPNAATPPNFVALSPPSGTSPTIQFFDASNNVCSNSAASTNSTYPICYSYPYLGQGNNVYVSTLECNTASVFIQPNSFSIRVFYAPSQNSNLHMTGFTAKLSGYYNGVKYSGPTLVVANNYFYRSFSNYYSVGTILYAAVDGSLCVTAADITKPHVEFTSTLSDNSTFSQTIDIVQNVYAIPPIGTWVVDNTATFFTNDNTRPQNVVWLNDAINLYDLPPLVSSAPGRTLHLEPRIMPENVEMFSGPAAFTAWKIKNGKQYNTAVENSARQAIFQQNMKRVALLNAKEPKARYGATQFADMTVEEVEKNYTGLTTPANPSVGSAPVSTNFTPLNSGPTPASYDWRAQGAVTAVKDQGAYGACTEFSATAVMEGQHFFQTGNLVALSEQQLIDCSIGTWVGYEFDSIIALSHQGGGQMSEADYPYQGPVQNCQYVASKAVGQITSWTLLNDWDPTTNSTIPIPEDQLATYLYQMGPLSIGINIDQITMYVDGIAGTGNCDPNNRGHAVTLVGYGDLCGTPYWIIKNSWGSAWGNEGYLYLRRYPGNTGPAQCGMNMTVVAAFYEKNVSFLRKFAGTLTTQYSNWQGSSWDMVVPLVNSPATGCQSYSLTLYPNTNIQYTVLPNNTLAAQDWTNFGPDGPSNYYVAPTMRYIFQNNAPSITDTLTFASCTSCTNTPMPPTTVTLSTNSTPTAYIIATVEQGDQAPNKCLSIPLLLPTSLTIAADTFKARLVVIPDSSQETTTIVNATVTLYGYDQTGTMTRMGYNNVVSSSLNNSTATDYFDFTYPDNIQDYTNLSIRIDSYFSNNVSLSVTKPFVQETFYVPPVMTLIATPIFSPNGNTLDFILLNDAINAYSATST